MDIAALERKTRIESVKGIPVGATLAGIRKFSSHYCKDISGRTVTGIFAVLGNVDDYNDRIWPGAFAKTLLELTPRVKFLWGHDLSSPSIARIQSVREVGLSDLPDTVKQIAPDAIGGMEVTREYLDVPLADWVLKTYQADIEGEMSFMFDAMKYDLETPPNAKYEWDKLRNLREVRLWEISDVNFGANAATVGGSKLRMPDAVLLAQIAALADEVKAAVKAGARHSTGDMKIINDLHAMLVDLGCTTCKGILDEAEQGADTDAADEKAASDRHATAEEQAATENTSRAVEAPTLTQLQGRLKQFIGSI